jgi:hypothetical protein
MGASTPRSENVGISELRSRGEVADSKGELRTGLVDAVPTQESLYHRFERAGHVKTGGRNWAPRITGEIGPPCRRRSRHSRRSDLLHLRCKTHGAGVVVAVATTVAPRTAGLDSTARLATAARLAPTPARLAVLGTGEF